MDDKRKTRWTDEEIEKLVTLWLNGYSLSYIGEALQGRGKSSCKGKIWRITGENPALYDLKKKIKKEKQKETKQKETKPKKRKVSKSKKKKPLKTNQHTVYHGQKHSMCWLCQHAAFDCKKPVDGWKAEKKTVRYYNCKKELRMYETVVVKKCPNFEPDPWVDRIDPYERQKYYSN